MSYAGDKRGRRTTGSSELALALPIIFAAVSFIFLVALNFAAIAVAYGSCYLIARHSCSKAASAANFDGALSSMSTASTSLINGPIGKLGRLVPIKGYRGSGTDLLLSCTNIYTDQTTVTKPNQMFDSVDTTSNVYECCTQVHYLVLPLMNFASVPVLGAIPGFGQPLQLACDAHKAIEQPSAFAKETAANANASVDATPDQTKIFGVQELCGWDLWTPQTQNQPGQVIYQEGSAVVYANDPNWITINDSHGNPLSLGKNQRLSLVFNTSSLWSYAPNQYAGPTGNNTWVNGMPQATVEFKVGVNGAARRPNISRQNMSLPLQGVLYFRCNDNNYSNNSLTQRIQALVTN